MKKKLLLSVAVLFSSMLGFAQNSLSMDAVKIAPGKTAQVSVNLNNSTAYTAFQFDMTLPKGITVKEATLADRASGHTLKTGTVNGKYRVLAYSYNAETNEGNKPITGSEGAIVNLTLEAGESVAEGATIVIDAGNQSQDGGQVFVEADGTTNYSMGEVTAAVTVSDVTEGVKAVITAAKKALFYSDKSLDFSSVDGVKAYIVTGYDNEKGTIWLNQVKVVPANTAVLLEGEKGEYIIPVTTDGTRIYKNMLVGSLTATTVNKDGGEGITNYILSNGDNGVGFYYAKESGSSIKAGGAYLPLPTSLASVGTAGSTEEVSINKYGMVCYYSDQSLDFSGSDLQDVKAYTAYGYDKKGTILLTRVKKVPANTAVLLLAPAEAKKYNVPTASLQQVYSNMFIGSLTGKTVQKEEDGMINYYVSVVDGNVGFYLASESGTKISAKRGWLPVPKELTVFAAATRGISSNGLSINLSDDVITMSLNGYGDDDATGINRVASEVGNDTWYNLKGQRIDTPTRKGLYIKNGKKVIVK